MTPTSAQGGGTLTAHDDLNPVGRALYLGGDPQRPSALYGEARLNRLLTARGPMLRALLARMFRMLGSEGVSFDWREMTQFILNADQDERRAEQGRRRIARAYYQACCWPCSCRAWTSCGRPISRPACGRPSSSILARRRCSTTRCGCSSAGPTVARFQRIEEYARDLWR